MAPIVYPRKFLVTGGAGFIGSAIIRHLLQDSGVEVLNFDKLTYAANLASLRDSKGASNYKFCEADICDETALRTVFDEFRPDAVIHCAAESHVDRSIAGPAEFIKSNLVGTYCLLEVTLEHWKLLPGTQKDAFRFLHVSTDEVYGSLGQEGLFSESTPYAPRSPYSASKAGSDHLVMAWHHTFGLPIVMTHSSNNYGPYQFPEKLVPLVILNAIEEKPLPIYGTGENVRDWLHVDDHVFAMQEVLNKGRVGERYNIGGNNERSNIEVVTAICEVLDTIRPRSAGSYREQIEFVDDRPGHDMRYAIDATKISRELDWAPTISIDEGIGQTVRWYLDNQWWWQSYRS